MIVKLDKNVWTTMGKCGWSWGLVGSCKERVSNGWSGQESWRNIEEDNEPLSELLWRWCKNEENDSPRGG